MTEPADEQPRYAPDWYETAIRLATLARGAHGGEVRLYLTADGRYFRFDVEPPALTVITSEYPTGEAEELSVEEARVVYSRSDTQLVPEDEAFPR